MFTKWMKVKVGLGIAPFVFFGLHTAFEAVSGPPSHLDRVHESYQRTRESLEVPLTAPGGGGICDGCYVIFADPHTQVR